MTSGDDLQRMLEGTMKQKISCRKCGQGFSFEAGSQWASKNGIRDKVVACPNCNSVYEVDVSRAGVKLLEDVSSRYAEHLASSSAIAAEQQRRAQSCMGWFAGVLIVIVIVSLLILVLR